MLRRWDARMLSCCYQQKTWAINRNLESWDPRILGISYAQKDLKAYYSNLNLKRNEAI